jgi:hypothetical protein
VKSESRKKVWREARNAVLLSDNPYFQVEDPEEGLHTTMSDVHDFINASLEMDMNPLPYLRKYFPGFEWAFFQGEKKDRFLPSIGEQVQCADYIWHTYASLRDTGEIITARQVGRNNHRMLFYVASRKRDVSWTWTRDVSGVAPKVRFVFYENGEVKIEKGAK